METQTASLLFSSNLCPTSSFSDGQRLIEMCPSRFGHGNSWSDAALLLFLENDNVDTSDWKWRSDDQATRDHQKNCLYGLLSTFCLTCYHKKALAGWMLSEMLTDVPASTFQQIELTAIRGRHQAHDLPRVRAPFIFNFKELCLNFFSVKIGIINE